MGLGLLVASDVMYAPIVGSVCTWNFIVYLGLGRAGVFVDLTSNRNHTLYIDGILNNGSAVSRSRSFYTGNHVCTHIMICFSLPCSTSQVIVITVWPM